jgi:predicted RNase H-like HicB family nuclease
MIETAEVFMPTTKAVPKRRLRRPTTNLTFQVAVVVEPDGDEYFAYCSDLPGVLMPGATPQEALENACVAARLCLETMIEYGDPIPLGLQAQRKLRRPTR